MTRTPDELQSLRRQLVSELSKRCRLIELGETPMSDIREIQLEIAAVDALLIDLNRR